MNKKNINENNNDKVSNPEEKNITENTKNEDEKKEVTPEELIKELQDKLTRTFAEMENQRRRYEKEKDDAFEYGGFNFARETLNLLDNLDRSKITLENDEKLKNSDLSKKIFEHLDIIKKDMVSIFKKNNIEQIETINKKLNPNFHQAMMEVEDASKDPGTIVQEIQTGFMMKDRLLRPALVAVSKKPNNSEKKDEIDKNEAKKDKN
ncbi:nucleotide exchange factor GrpE [Candidatus Pelagibacter sp.]|nr:nucleotide exchange factor GrpE [Candidatus Pelagibacter sp.]